jgi:serine/threonine protein kinase
MREAAVLAKLNHPNIIRMYGVIVEPIVASPSAAASISRMSSGSSSKDGGGGGGDFGSAPRPHQPQTALIAGIMTDFVRGGSLKDQLRHATRCLTLKERCQVAVQAARGMAYLHAQSPAVIHFDLKPDNLLVDGDGDTLHVKVADFVSPANPHAGMNPP